MSPKKQKKPRRTRLFWLVGGLVISLALIQLFISQRLAIAGQTVKSLETEAAKFETENRHLKEEIAGLGSLILVSDKAEELGLVKTSQMVHFSSLVPVAMNPNQ